MKPASVGFLFQLQRKTDLMKQSAIAAVIERDLLHSDAGKPSIDITKCFSCGFSMRYRGSRCCSERCREWFDTGNPGYDQDWLYRQPSGPWRVIAGPPGTVGTEYHNPDMRPTKSGFMIRCAHCTKEFDSRGLRCCSTECERRYRERKDNLAVMAEVCDAPKERRRCAHPGCGRPIPTWRNGRRVSRATRFCSDSCSRQAKKLAA
jgi:hypothetical protein